MFKRTKWSTSLCSFYGRTPSHFKVWIGSSQISSILILLIWLCINCLSILDGYKKVRRIHVSLRSVVLHNARCASSSGEVSTSLHLEHASPVLFLWHRCLGRTFIMTKLLQVVNLSLPCSKMILCWFHTTTE